jgi:hypothetical protein
MVNSSNLVGGFYQSLDPGENRIRQYQTTPSRLHKDGLGGNGIER